MHPLAASILFHAIGATAAACCYVPQKRVRRWSWQSYWLTQAAFCWLLLPIAGAFLTVPGFRQVVLEAPRDVMWRAFLLGAAYGIGGTAFGVAIKEWAGVRPRTRTALVTALTLLIAGKLLLDYGNYLGSRDTRDSPGVGETGSPAPMQPSPAAGPRPERP